MYDKELSDEEKETYAEMYIEEMEDKWLRGEPYRNAISVAIDIRNDAKCSTRDAISICKIISKTKRDRLEGMLYEVSEFGSFHLSDEALTKVTQSGEGS